MMRFSRDNPGHEPDRRETMPRGAPRLRKEGGQQNAVGARVKFRRKELKLSQDALCARLALRTSGGWSPTEADIYRIEQHRRIVSDLELVALAAALECDLLWLLGVDNNARPTTLCDVWFAQVPST
jgi:transcriptional regulator with XRE-family HTH domain